MSNIEKDILNMLYNSPLTRKAIIFNLRAFHKEINVKNFIQIIGGLRKSHLIKKKNKGYEITCKGKKIIRGENICQ